jgi:hypothetical protein
MTGTRTRIGKCGLASFGLWQHAPHVFSFTACHICNSTPLPQLSWSHDCCDGIVQNAEIAAKTSTFLISAIKVTGRSLVTVIEWLHVDAFSP